MKRVDTYDIPENAIPVSLTDDAIVPSGTGYITNRAFRRYWFLPENAPAYVIGGNLSPEYHLVYLEEIKDEYHEEVIERFGE